MQLIIEIYFSNDTDYRLEIIVIFGHGGQEKILISNIWDTYYRMLRSTNLQDFINISKIFEFSNLLIFGIIKS